MLSLVSIISFLILRSPHSLEECLSLTIAGIIADLREGPREATHRNRSCKRLGSGAASRYDGGSHRRCGGCKEAWSRRVARRLWRRSASARMRRRQDQVEPHGETTMVLKRHEVGTPRSGGDTRQDDGRVVAWSRRIAMKPWRRSVAESTIPWVAARLAASRRVAMRHDGSKARRGGGRMDAERSSNTWEGQLESGGDRGGAAATLVVMEFSVTARVRGLRRRKAYA